MEWGNKQMLSKEFTPSIMKGISGVTRAAWQRTQACRNKLNSIQHKEKRKANVRVTDGVYNSCKMKI